MVTKRERKQNGARESKKKLPAFPSRKKKEEKRNTGVLSLSVGEDSPAVIWHLAGQSPRELSGDRETTGCREVRRECWRKAR